MKTRRDVLKTLAASLALPLITPFSMGSVGSIYIHYPHRAKQGLTSVARTPFNSLKEVQEWFRGLSPSSRILKVNRDVITAEADFGNAGIQTFYYSRVA